MVQGVSNQYLEANAKLNQLAAKNINAKTAGQNNSFQSYMKEMDNRRDVSAKRDDLGKKDVYRNKNEQPPKDTPVKDAPVKDSQATDAVKKDDSSSKPSDENLNKDEAVGKGEETEKDTKVNDNAQNLIDLAAMAKLLAATIVTEEKPTTATGEEVKPAIKLAADTALLNKAQQTVPTETIVLPNNEQISQLNSQANNKLAELIAETTKTTEVQTDKTVEAAVVVKPETAAEKTTLATNTASVTSKAEQTDKTANKTNTEAENTAQSKEVLSTKATESKPVEVKVSVNTNKSDAQTTKQAQTEEAVDVSVLAAKTEKPELPTVNVKVGDGGQLNTKQMSEDIAEAIIKKTPEKPNEFEIQLTPKELGKITIKLLFENGQTIVSLSAANSKTMTLLSDCAKTIGALIQQHTGNETVVNVQDDKSFTDQQKQEGNRHNAESQQQENAEKQKRQQSANQDFMQQMRLGLFDGDYADSRSRFY